MALKEFVERTVRLGEEPFSFDGRPYLDALYRSDADKIVLRASRQTEKSTYLVNQILYRSNKEPGFKTLFLAPRIEQARVFSRVRIADAIRDSPILRRLLWGQDRPLPPFDIFFKNRSRIFVRSAYLNADAARGISAEMEVIDEFQDLAHGELPVVEETLSHAEGARLLLAGTPKLIDNHLEKSFAESTACEWHVSCQGCGHANLMDERVLGPTALVCAECQLPIHVRDGHWVARNPQSTWGEGYWINHLMVPWIEVPEVVGRQQSYDSVRFRNEVLGLPVSLGDHLITREQIEACCDDRPFARTIADIPPDARPRLVAGLDWGGGGVSATVLVLGYIDRNRIFRVVYLQRWAPYSDPGQMLNEIARLCAHFHVRVVAADGGGFGRQHNRLLLDRLRQEAQSPSLYSIFYSGSQGEPVRNGASWDWTIDRSDSIGTLFGRIRMGQLRFPRVAESSSFLDEFLGEVAVYDAENRSIRFTKPESLRDDALHATNYCELLGLRMPASAIG